MQKPGVLIVIDGIDKVGKSVQTDLLVKRLRREGKKVRTVSFPRYKENLLGGLLKECLEGKRGDFLHLDPKIASVLYAADRFETKSFIERYLREGYVVVCNRYVSANQIHQGGKLTKAKARKAFISWLDRLEYRVFNLPRPHITIQLRMPVALSLTLLKKSRGKDTVEEDLTYYKNSARAASSLARSEKWERVECSRGEKILPREEIHEKVYSLVHGIV